MRRVWISAVFAVLGACGEPHRELGAGADGEVEGTRLAPTGIRFLGEGDTEGYARATEPGELSFPRDHGSHDRFRTEWWYFTGNLDSPAGAHYGFELTFFRVALRPEAVARESAWSANQVWMAHFAVTDVEGGSFAAAERFARGSLGLAGADAEPFRVWVKDWSVAGLANGEGADLTLSARDGARAVQLQLHSANPPVAQGDDGLDAKGPEPGNASYYYSFPRLEARGSIEIEGVKGDVTGRVWMDREWGTSALSAGVVGWDWFALQLSDGRDLMYYRLRLANGDASPFSGGSVVGADGVARRLAADDVLVGPVDHWRSARSGVRYPVAWRLSVPSEGLVLDVSPFLEDQEVALSVRYWEGAVRVAGAQGAARVTGVGYLELAGY